MPTMRIQKILETKCNLLFWRTKNNNPRTDISGAFLTTGSGIRNRFVQNPGFQPHTGPFES
jgi:hypothetical protein